MMTINERMIPDRATQIIFDFSSEEYEVYLVDGCVRDLL